MLGEKRGACAPRFSGLLNNGELFILSVVRGVHVVQTQKGSVISDTVVIGSDTQRGVSWFLCYQVLSLFLNAFCRIFLGLSTFNYALHDVRECKTLCMNQGGDVTLKLKESKPNLSGKKIKMTHWHKLLRHIIDPRGRNV